MLAYRAAHPDGVAHLECIIQHHNALQIHRLAILHVFGSNFEHKYQIYHNDGNHWARRAHQKPTVHGLICNNSNTGIIVEESPLIGSASTLYLPTPLDRPEMRSLNIFM